MAWTTPTLAAVRKMVRDGITASLSGAVIIGNSVLRVMADAMAGLAHLALQYLDWLARQLLPDTAEREWLDRHGDIWLTNADGTRGRKAATFAAGFVNATGSAGAVVPVGTPMRSVAGINYETTQHAVIGSGATRVAARATDAGAIGNLETGAEIAFTVAMVGIDAATAVDVMEGGADAEGDDDLRLRVLERIQKPPMGGDADDYVAWAKQVPGVTRAWCAPLEMGIGTVTVRFMMDDLRAANDGVPIADDVARVAAYIDQKRPVAVKDCFVVAPLRQEVAYTITGLDNDTSATRAAIEAALAKLFRERAKPGQTMHLSWAGEVVSAAAGEDHHTLSATGNVMASAGHMPILGTVVYA